MDLTDIDPAFSFSRFDLASHRSVIAAVSGGSDSLAMLLLLLRWLRKTTPDTRLLAVTVDHRLRPDSAAEAGAVARICAAHGIAHRTMVWSAAKPATGVPAAARVARYQLLAEAAEAETTDLVITGHTADDQTETVTMRSARGDGRGLAGMAPATLFCGKTWVIRPLLQARRDELRAFLRTQDVAWIDDPTNVDATYERARVRAGLKDAPHGGVAATAADAAAAARRRKEQGRRAAALVERHATQPMPGLLKLDRTFLETDDSEAAIAAFRMLLAVSGGVEHLPDAARSSALFERLRAGPCRATLSRTVADGRKTSVFLQREVRGLPAAAMLADGAIWDGRYRITTGGKAVSVAAGGDDADRANDGEAPRGVRRRVLAAAPRPQAADGDDGHHVCVTPVLAPARLFLPSFDLALASAIARLVGAAEIPKPPFAGHNGEEG